MSSYEYTVIPAPARAEKSKGARAGIDRFAATLAEVLNGMARDGWEYVRAEVLPAEERSGLTSRATVYHNLLVFRRAIVAAPRREAIVEPAAVEARTPAPLPTPEPAREPAGAAVDLPADSVTDPAPARAPFSQPMRPVPRPQGRNAEPPLTAPELVAPGGPRLGPASR